jgi:hypothetical protein
MSVVVSTYFVLSFCGAWWLDHYMGPNGDSAHVPHYLYLVFGPLISLVYGDAIFIYIAATAIVVPLLLLAVQSGPYLRLIWFLSAVSFWVAIGHWMYAG